MSLKILVFSDWYLPGTQAGGPTQSLHSMTQHVVNASFFIVTRNTDHGSNQPYSVQTETWISNTDQTHVFYLNEKKINEAVFEKIIFEIQPHWIYLNSLWSPLFTQLPLKIAKKHELKFKVICAPRGMLKPEALKIKPFKKKGFLLLSRIRKTYSNIVWHATSEIESREIRHFFGAHANVHIAPNLASLETTDLEEKNKSPNQLHLFTVARVSIEKGILEAAELLAHWNKPAVWKIAGLLQDSDLVNHVNALLKNTEIKHEWLGHLNREQIRDYYQWAHVFYLPTRGENFGHAIAEGLSAGLPAIISNATPWQNLSMEGAGFDLPIDKNAFHEAFDFYWSMQTVDYSKCRTCAQNYIRAKANKREHINQLQSLFFKE